MRCHVCNAEVADGQKFCHECGQDLAGVTDRTDEVARPTAVDADLDTTPLDPPTTIDADLDTTPLDPPTTIDADLDTTPLDPPTTIDADLDTKRFDELATTIDPDIPTQPLAPPTAIDADLETRPLDEVPVPAAGEPPPLPPEEDVTDELDRPDDDVLISTWSDEHPVTVAGAAAMATTALASDPTATTELGTTTDPLPDDVTTRIFDGQPHLQELPPGREPFRLRVSFVLSLFGLIAAVLVSVADIVDIRTNRPVPGIEVGLRDLDVFGTNLAVAGYIGGAVMVLGALASCFGFRWGAGLAGGAGLALVGWAAMVIGLAEVPIDRAQTITRDPSTPGPFTLTVTRDLGYWLLVAVAVIALVVFLLSLRLSGTGGRRGLNPWLAAVGAVGSLVAAVGPLIPLDGLSIGDNFGAAGLPTLYFTGRLLQVGLLAFTGVLGFLSVRVYGLGLVGGGLGVSLYLWATSLGEFGDRPIGIGVANLTATTPSTVPHAVTSVGIIVTFVMLVAATVTATVATSRTA